MNRPSPLTRLMGCRPLALVLMFASGVVFAGWVAGDVPWWLAIVAALTQMQTLAAVGRVRRYKDWSAKWQAMAEPVGAQRPAPASDRGIGQNAPSAVKEPRRGRLRITLAVLLVLAIPVYVADGTDMVSSGLRCLWFAACLYLAARLLRRVFGKRANRQGERPVAVRQKAESPFVAWVMAPASSSPSRAEAVRALPDYCARLLDARSGR